MSMSHSKNNTATWSKVSGVPIQPGELQSPGSGPFFGGNGKNFGVDATRKHRPDPFALDFAVLLRIRQIRDLRHGGHSGGAAAKGWT